VEIIIPRTGTAAIIQAKSIHSLHSNPKHYAISSNVKIRRPEDRKDMTLEGNTTTKAHHQVKCCMHNQVSAKLRSCETGRFEIEK
jgi:hypothetical protein